MNAIIAAALAFAFSQIILSLLLLLRQPGKWAVQERLLFLFLSAVPAYLAHPIAAGTLFAPLQTLWENALPGLFWLFCSSVFDDGFQLNYRNISVVVFTVAIPFIGRTLGLEDHYILHWVLIVIPQAIEFALLGLALWAIIRWWRDDLIESRRDLRFWFCSMAGVYILVLVLLRELVFPDATWLELWQYLPVGIICLITNILLLQYRPGQISYSNAPPAVSEIDESPTKPLTNTTDVPQEIVDQLDHLMNKERIYREMGLTIGQVAKRLDLQEYRLRKIINAGLGYRNFNDYLNGFRIREAGIKLTDPDFANVAILNIALDTGFRSLSSFNKAFRESFGKTPTAYRKEHLLPEK